jgi:hypothetical protein
LPCHFRNGLQEGNQGRGWASRLLSVPAWREGHWKPGWGGGMSGRPGQEGFNLGSFPLQPTENRREGGFTEATGDAGGLIPAKSVPQTFRSEIESVAERFMDTPDGVWAGHKRLARGPSAASPSSGRQLGSGRPTDSFEGRGTGSRMGSHEDGFGHHGAGILDDDGGPEKIRGGGIPIRTISDTRRGVRGWKNTTRPRGRRS